MSLCRTLEGANWNRCVNYCTLKTIIILMETIKDLYIARLPRRWAICRSAVQCGQLGICTDDVPSRGKRAAGTTPTALPRDSVTLDDLIFGAATRRTVRCPPVDTASHSR